MRTLFTVAFVIELLFGLGFIAVPRTLVSFYGVTLSDFGVTLARLFGSALLGFAVLLWFGRASEDAETRRTVLASMFTYWVVSTLFALLGQLAGVTNAMGWGIVLLHLILAVAFGVFLFR